MRNHKRIAVRAVQRIVWDLTDRIGLRQSWESVDDDVKKEIVREWRQFVLEALAEKERQ